MKSKIEATRRSGCERIVVGLVAACALGVTGCDQLTGRLTGTSARAVVEESSDGLTPEERRFADAARPFLQAVARGDAATAHGFLSSGLRQRLTPEQFAAEVEKAFLENGKPIALGSVHGVETRPEILIGPARTTGEDALDQAANRMLAHDAVGTMPDSIPAALRRASVKGEMVLSQSADGDNAAYLLTVVLIQEGDQLRVGHYWFRHRGLWD